MTTLKEKLDEIKSSNHKGYGNSDILRLVAALEKAVEQRDVEIDYMEMNSLVFYTEKYKGGKNIELLAILEGVK